MRIFYFPSFYPSDRPKERWTGAFTHRQVKALAALGVDIKVILPELGYPSWPVYTIFADWRESKARSHGKHRKFDGIDVYHPRITNRKPSRLFSKTYKIRYIEATAKLLSHFSLDGSKDYFFAQWLPEAEYVVELGKQLGIKTAVLGIGDDILKIPMESQANLKSFANCWENADIRGVVADYLGKFSNILLKKNLPYEVFYSSVDFEEFFPVSTSEKCTLRTKLGLPESKIIILTVGSPIIRKGWLDLFDALSDLNLKEHFVLIGINGGAAEIDLNMEVNRRLLNKNWINLGEVPPAEISKFYQASDIFCLPSHWEGLANAVLEGMASGLAVITTPVSGHPEVLVDNLSGLFVPVSSPKILASTLAKLIQNEPLRNRLGKNARQSLTSKPGSHNDVAKKIIYTLNASR